MILRNETFVDSVCVSAEIIDLDAGTLAVEENGAVLSSRLLTPQEVQEYEPTPEELARTSAIEKLKALGLTEQEALALIGQS
jgi:hypothetical protein